MQGAKRPWLVVCVATYWRSCETRLELATAYCSAPSWKSAYWAYLGGCAVSGEGSERTLFC
jgi:hypothetical protein